MSFDFNDVYHLGFVLSLPMLVVLFFFYEQYKKKYRELKQKFDELTDKPNQE